VINDSESMQKQYSKGIIGFVTEDCKS